MHQVVNQKLKSAKASISSTVPLMQQLISSWPHLNHKMYVHKKVYIIVTA